MKLIYRPEIDGLRAIAVIAVILYHAQISIYGYQPFKGGFIGVDIFFVISGYLITSIILKELFDSNTFSFKRFFERRARRILPVLLAVMLFSLPFAWIFLIPSSLIDFCKSIIYSLGFSSNFYFWYSGQQYGAESGLLKPFLHTWSLSVEEQFYILFPIIILITFRYFKNYLIYILILGFLMSLGLADWISKNHPSFNFYVLPTRAWELLAGSVLAYFEIKKGYRSVNTKLNSILSIIGIFLIGHSILFFDNENMPHPSLYTLSPIIGTCLIIWYLNKDEFITKILSLKIFVGIGLISYSLYLWHYPIFAFAREINFFDGYNLHKFFFIFVAFLLSVFSYYFIEKPFRDKRIQFKKILMIFLITIIFLITSNYYGIFSDGVLSRLPKNMPQEKLRLKDANFFQKENTQKILLVGDSHAEALEFQLNEEIKKNDLSLYRFKTALYLNNFNFSNKKTGKIEESYSKRNNRLDKFINENSNLVIIMHYRWSIKFLETYFNNEEGFKEQSKTLYRFILEPKGIKTTSRKEREKFTKEALKDQIENILKAGHKLILVYPVPEMGFHPIRLLYRKYLFEKNFSTNALPILSGSYDVFKKRNELIFEILDSIQNPNIHRVYPHNLFCNTIVKDRCVANDKKNIFYFDDDHLSAHGSKLVAREIMSKIYP